MSNELRDAVERAAPTPSIDLGDVYEGARRRTRRSRIAIVAFIGVITAVSLGGLLRELSGVPVHVPTNGYEGKITVHPLPINGVLRWSREDARVVHDAQQILMHACMVDAGCDPPVLPFVVGVDPDFRRYGLTDQAEARTLGWRLPPAFRADDQEDAIMVYRASLPPDDRRAFDISWAGREADRIATEYGSAPGGCSAYVDDTLYGSRADSIRAADLTAQAQFLQVGPSEEAQRDGRVIAAKLAWGTCMQMRGFDAGNEPLDVSLIALDHPEIERELAEATVICSDEVDLVETWSAIEAGYQDRMLATDRAWLDELLALRREALLRAGEIVREA